MHFHWHLMHELVASRQGDLIRAAEAHRLAAAVLGTFEPSSPRRWLGDRLVALGRLIAAEPAPAPRHLSHDRMR